MQKLSAYIITFNEEKNILRTLQSLIGVADEIIVVDSYSHDQTEAIVRQFFLNHKDTIQGQLITQKFLGYVEQKNFALDHTTHPYTLSLDGDEVLSDDLRNNIIKEKRNFRYKAYSFHRLTRYNQQWIRHSGWYPDTKLRLTHRDYARWQGTNPHDILTLTTDTTVCKLPGDLLHYSYESIHAHVEQTNKFTTIQSRVLFQEGKRTTPLIIFTRPWLKFFRDYFFKKGFLDGTNGFVICFINALSVMLKYAKLYELQNERH